MKSKIQAYCDGDSPLEGGYCTEVIHGKIKDGYCYDFQCWIKNFIVQPCGHPENMKPGCCFAGENGGRDIRGIYAKMEAEETEAIIAKAEGK